MKIKRVEIQAFKSYNHVKDGTFLFSDDSGKPSNFISIFAPNGFGKTSFCDAVDFAITNKIHRYSRMKQIEKYYGQEIGEGNQSGERQFVIRNKFADDALETSISIAVDNRREPIQSEYKKPRSGGGDYNVNRDPKPGSEFFQHAMLYQEAIDSVLRETNPEERFSKLAENEANLSDITEKRKSLIAAKNEAEKEKETAETEKDRITQEIRLYDGKKKDISTLNAHLKQINGILNKEEFGILAELQPFTQEQYDQLEQSAISATRTIEDFKSIASSTKSELIEHQSKLEIYQAAFADRSALEQELSVIMDAIDTKQALLELEKMKSFILEEVEQYARALSELEKNKAQVSDYFELKQAYDSEFLEQKKLNEQEEQIASTLSSSKKEHEKLNEDLAESNKELQKQQELLNKADQVFKEISELKKREQEHVQKLRELILQEKNIDEDIDTKQSSARALNRLSIESTNLIEYRAIIAKNLLPEFMKQQSLYKAYSESINEKQLLLASKKQELEQVQIHSTQLQQLIAQAHDLILHTKQSDCPVCQHSYADFSILEAKLKENPIYQNREQLLSEESAALNKHITELKEVKKNASNKYYTLKSAVLQQFDTAISLAQDHKKELEISRLRLEQEQSKTKDDVNALNEKVAFKDKRTYVSDISKELNRLEGQSKQIREEAHKKEGEIRKLNEQEGHLRKFLEKQNQTVSGLKIRLKSFAEFITFLENKNWQSLESEKSLTQAFTTEIERASLSRQKQSDSAKKIEEELQKLKEKLPDKFVMDAISELENKKETLQNNHTKVTERVLQFERTMDGINYPSDYRQNIEQVRQFITEKVKELDGKVATYRAGVSNLETAKALAKALVGAEGLEALENKYQFVDKKENVLKDVIAELQDDIDALGKFIQSKVDAFFKTELINQLYQAIDPHPEFKNICFECKTDGDKPKLLIKAETSDGSMNVSPVLSFSSAQVNVLALSIFLARALTLTDGEGNPVNCIFIDDPVQSIDSINTLSLIDLFRVLTVKFDKQLIVTTHDENFHELLKKKMPEDLFPSKYFRLESFGKVTLDAA